MGEKKIKHEKYNLHFYYRAGSDGDDDDQMEGKKLCEALVLSV